ncbi:MAG: hypothetical protein ACKVP0_04085 [Pirellulaceae bacterium]
MNIQWSKTCFASLKECWLRSEGRIPDADEIALVSRYVTIVQIVGSDRFWPPTSGAKDAFVPALCEVLARLPEKAFEFVESQISFVLEDPTLDALAVNVPLPEVEDFGRPGGANETSCLIVFYRSAWKLSTNGLIGLIAHELAHSFVGGKDYEEDEAKTDDKAHEWGFEQELLCLENEKRTL